MALRLLAVLSSSEGSRSVFLVASPLPCQAGTGDFPAWLWSVAPPGRKPVVFGMFLSLPF